MLEVALYVILSLMLVGIFIIIGIRYKMNKERKSKEIPKSIQEEFVEIEKFNEDKYIEDTFESVFHSVQIDEWETEVDHDEIKFTKKPKGSSSWNSIDLKVKYKIKNGKFLIDMIFLYAGNHFTYKGKLNIDDYKFFYKKYADYKNEENRKSKESCDSSLNRIHNILGKSTLRDAKIDEILNK